MDSSEAESDSVTERLYNLDKLNEDGPEVLVGAAWRRGQIPESPKELVESLVQRVNRGMVRFEKGSFSLGQNLQSPLDRDTNLGIELGQTSIVKNAPRSISQSLTRSLDTRLDNLNNLSPISPSPGPPSPGSAYSDLYPLSLKQKEEIKDLNLTNSTTSVVSRKSFRVEFGRLGRNIRQRLLYGFCPNEGTSELSVNPIDFPLSYYDDSFDNYVNGNGFGHWEAGPKQLPQGPRRS